MNTQFLSNQKVKYEEKQGGILHKVGTVAIRLREASGDYAQQK